MLQRQRAGLCFCCCCCFVLSFSREKFSASLVADLGCAWEVRWRRTRVHSLHEKKKGKKFYLLFRDDHSKSPSVGVWADQDPSNCPLRDGEVLGGASNYLETSSMKGGVLAVLTPGRVIRSVPILALGRSVTVQESWAGPGLLCTSGVPHRLAGGRRVPWFL